MARVPSSLNLLRTFEAAGRHLNFTLAGQELCITTSAVSQQIRALERQLGLQLFQRQARGLVLTDAGERYWRDIQHHLQGIEASTRTLLRPDTSAVLRVSLMPPMASRIVLPRLADFQQAHPDVILRLDASLRYLDVAGDETDLAIRYGTPPWPGCEHEKLLDLYAMPVCPTVMAEQLDIADDPSRLRDLPLVHMTERPDTWKLYFDALGLGEPAPPREYFVNDYPAAIEAAETLGAALAVLPLEQPLLDSRRLAAPLPAMGPLPGAVYAVTRRNSARRKDVRTFLTWLRAQLDTLPEVTGVKKN